jgi:hypothetical protein
MTCRRAVSPSVAHPPPRDGETAGAPASIPRNGFGAFDRLHGLAPLESPCSR